MANNWNEFVTNVKLNTSEAENRLKTLKQKTDDLIKQRDKLINGGSSKTQVNALQKQINQNEKSMRQLQKQATNVIDVINNMDSSSLVQLQQAQRMLNAEMQKTPQNTDYFKQLNEKLQSVKTSIAGIRAESRENYNEMSQARTAALNLSNVLGNLNTSSMKELTAAAAEAKRQMSEAKPNTQEYEKAATSLKTIQTRITEINRSQQQVNTAIDRYNDEINRVAKDTEKTRKETELIDKTLKNLSTANIREMEYTVQVLNERLRETDRGTEAYKRLENQLKQVKAQLSAVAEEQSVASKGSTWSRFAESMNKNAVAITTLLSSITGLTMTVRKCVDAYTEMDQEMNNVRKYTGQTMAQVEEMNEDFKMMNTRTSREELNQLAGAAGRLGITAKDCIEEFVEAADKIGVALGDDLGQGAVDKIGKLAQVFGEDKTKGLRGAMLATGSAVNELAQSSSANAGYIVDFTADLAGVARQANMSQAEIMGLASALDQNMQEEATSSTVFSQLITKMYQNPAKFAKIAGVDVAKFTKMLKTDANEALLTFMQTMQNKGGFDALAPMFQEMNLDGTRAVGVLSSVATHLDQVKEAQDTANKAYAAGNSVIGEFNVQNETEAAKIDKAKKAFKEITIELGQKLLPVARYGITTTSLAVKALAAIVNIATKYRATIIALTATIAALIIAEEGHIIKQKLIAFWNNVIVAGTKKLWAVLMANPYTAVAGAITVLIGLMIDLARRTNDQAKMQKQLNDIKKTAAERTAEETERVKNLEKAMNNGNLSMKERKKAADQLNAIIPGYNAKLDATRKKYVANKQKLDDYINSLVHLYEVMGAKDKIKELGEKRAGLVIDQKQAEKDLEAQQKYYEGQTKINASIGGREAKAMQMGDNTSLNIAKGKVEDIKKDIKDIDKQINNIKEAYGTDIQKSEVSKPEPGTDPNAGNNNSGGGGNTMSEKERKKQEAERKKKEAERKAAMKKEIDEEKDKTAKEQAENTFAYATGQKLYKDYLDAKHDIAEKGYDAIKKVYEKYGEDGSEYDQKKSEEELKKMEDRQKASIKEIEKGKAKEKALANDDYYNPSSDIYMNESALQERLFQIDMAAQQKKIDSLKAGSEDWIEARDEMEQMQQEHSVSLQQQYQERLARYREQWGKTDIESQKQIELKGLDELLKQKLIKEEEYHEMRHQIELNYELQKSEQAKNNSHNEVVRRNAQTAYQTASNYASADEGEEKPTLGRYLTGDITHYKDTVARLKEMYGEDAENFEEFQQAKSMAFGTMMEGVTSKAQAAFDSISQILDGMSSYFDAQSQYEQNIVTKKYEKQINAAGNNSAKKKKLEEKEQKEIAKIKTKYNKKAMKIELAQATASMILGAMNAYSSAMKLPAPGNMVYAQIAAGIAMAAGLLNIATIKKQHAAEEAGYYMGGFTGGSNFRRRAGIVHEGEFVANHQTLQNPNVMPVLQLIDHAQRTNTVGSLTANDVTRQLGQGGSAVVAPVVNVSNDNSELADTMDQARDTMDRLDKRLEDGINVLFSMEYFKKEERRWDKMQNNK